MWQTSCVVAGVEYRCEGLPRIFWKNVGLTIADDDEEEEEEEEEDERDVGGWKDGV